MLGVSLNQAFYHPNPNLQRPWVMSQLGLLAFPLSPFLGSLTLLFAAGITWRKQYKNIIRHPLNWGFGILSILLLLTTAFATNKAEAFLGVFNFLPFFFAFPGLAALIQTPAQLRQIAWLIVLGSIPILIFGFGQLFLGWQWQFQFLAIVLDWHLVEGGVPPGRMASILMHANTLAAYLTTVLILGLGLSLENCQQIKTRNPRFILLTVTVFANFIALILTDSRNGWAIAIFACLAFALYQGWRLLVAGFMSIVTTILLAAFAPSPIAELFRRFVPSFFWARLNGDKYSPVPVTEMRTTQWQFAWSLTQQQPWTGWGLRSFSGLYKAEMQVDINHPHNLFLMLSAETGILCTLLFCSLLLWILINAIQLLRQSQVLESKNKTIFFSYLLTLVGWLIFNSVDVTIFDIRLNTIFWVFLPAMCGVTYRYHKHNFNH
ncbi:MAG TPA: O-antigen ligase family protein [Nostocaceae cyanobacterium]|nr:O-antigen ligase family protein [Nostocaceae cyanobacterium]